MTNHLIITISFTVILGIVSGAPLCDKIQGESFTHRYKVTLEDPRYDEDVIELVEKYQDMADSSTNWSHLVMNYSKRKPIKASTILGKVL